MLVVTLFCASVPAISVINFFHNSLPRPLCISCIVCGFKISCLKPRVNHENAFLHDRKVYGYFGRLEMWCHVEHFMYDIYGQLYGILVKFSVGKGQGTTYRKRIFFFIIFFDPAV